MPVPPCLFRKTRDSVVTKASLVLTTSDCQYQVIHGLLDVKSAEKAFRQGIILPTLRAKICVIQKFGTTICGKAGFSAKQTSFQLFKFS